MHVENRTEDRRVRKTKTALRDGLASLLAEKNIRDITVRELTELVDINRATFYLHYRDIYDLQQQIEDEVVEQINRILTRYLPARGAERVYPLFMALLEYIRDNASLCKMVLSKNSGRTFLDKLCVLVQESCLQAWLNSFDETVSDQMLAFFSSYVVHGSVSVIEMWVDGGMKQSPGELAGLVGDMGLYGSSFLDGRAALLGWQPKDPL